MASIALPATVCPQIEVFLDLLMRGRPIWMPLICSNPLFLAVVTAAVMSPSVGRGGLSVFRRVEPDQNVVQ